MKLTKTLVFAAVTAVFSAGAHAQSSVTLYGSLDAGFAYINKVGGGALLAQTSGVLSNNYWGLRGVEDLGGGNRAIFKVESGFNVGNGRLGEWLSAGAGQGLFQSFRQRPLVHGNQASRANGTMLNGRVRSSLNSSASSMARSSSAS